MGLFDLRLNENKWIWFILTLIGSAIPLILRFFISEDFNIAKFDIKDLLFAALAINLSNLSLIGVRKFKLKIFLAAWTVLFIIIIAFNLGVTLRSEADKVENPLYFLKFLSIIVAIASAYLSFEANNYVFKNVD